MSRSIIVTIFFSLVKVTIFFSPTLYIAKYKVNDFSLAQYCTSQNVREKPSYMYNEPQLSVNIFFFPLTTFALNYGVPLHHDNSSFGKLHVKI